MRHVRTGSTVLALAATMLTASCISSSGETAGTPSESASPTPTPTPTLHTLDEVRAALPTEGTLTKTYDDASRTDPTTVALFCADMGATAPDDTSGAAVSAQSPAKAGGWNVFTSVVISGLVFPNSQAAERFVVGARTTAKRCEGEIDHDPIKVEDGFRPGERGRGTLSDVTANAWQGFRLVTVTRWSSKDDATGPSIAHGNVIVLHGNAVLVVSAVRPDDKPKAVTRTLERWASRVTREVG